MPVLRDYTVQTSVGALLTIMDSLGAHVGSKLQLFATDERTLTDDLCDMFYIWAQQPGIPTPKYYHPLLQRPLTMTISKSTQQEEADYGYDLGIKLDTPEGIKYAVLQAKVYDPQSNKLRCDSQQGWIKLSSQLILMRAWLQSWGSDLAYLLIYVPISKLARPVLPVSTWEIGVAQTLKPRSKKNAAFGATLIRFDSLLDKNQAWKLTPPVKHVRNGLFKPAGITLSRLLIDLLLCNQGRWIPRGGFQADGSGPNTELRHGFPFNYIPYREIGISVEDISREEWREYITELREIWNNELIG
ncbi:MAG TPA: hypothetical protein VJ843_05230 [Candidatus Saccharimonadales bacterium]|nr:hypothetical protein [Candidatus Saccharimonadales bacterium]